MQYDKNRLRVFVSGGGSGIGLSIAKSFAANGHEVTIGGRNEEKLRAARLPNVVLDVTDDASIKNAIAKAGPIDVFVANAGAAKTAPALRTERADWDHMLAVNLTSVYSCALATVPAMVERGWGRFIAIASTASLKGYAYTGAYAAAKHGVLGWVRSLAIELAKTGVTANAICPGFTDTPLLSKALDDVVEKTGMSVDDAHRAFVKDNPMARLIDPDEVATTALWLASDGAASVNGQAIAVDGGETIS